jgi:hypothetical protein
MAYPANTDAKIALLKEQLDTDLANGINSGVIETLEKLQGIRQAGSVGGGGASATDIGNAVNGTPITGQSLESGGNGGTGWLSSLRKAITDRLMPPNATASRFVGTSAGSQLKPAPGNVYSISATNLSTSTAYIQLFDSTTTLVTGATPIAVFPVYGNAGFLEIGQNLLGGAGIAFATGIQWGYSTTPLTYTAGTAANIIATIRWI